MAAWPRAWERMVTRRDYRPGNLPALRFLLSKPTALTRPLTNEYRFASKHGVPQSPRSAIVGSGWRGRPRERVKRPSCIVREFFGQKSTRGGRHDDGPTRM